SMMFSLPSPGRHRSAPVPGDGFWSGFRYLEPQERFDRSEGRWCRPGAGGAPDRPGFSAYRELPRRRLPRAGSRGARCFRDTDGVLREVERALRAGGGGGGGGGRTAAAGGGGGGRRRGGADPPDPVDPGGQPREPLRDPFADGEERGE